MIGCVDTQAAGATIAKCAEDWSEVDYWLDLGSNSDSGQFVLGEPAESQEPQGTGSGYEQSQSFSLRSSVSGVGPLQG